MKERIKQYFWNILIWMTQSLNVFTGGHVDQTFSGRTGVAYLRGKLWATPFKYIIDKFFKLVANQEEHCVNEIEWDRVSQDVIDEIRNKAIK